MGETVYLSEAYVGSYFLRVGLWGKSDGKYAGFKRYRGKNGVVVRDGELILWGMKAMPYILYFNELNHIKTSIFERNCL